MSDKQSAELLALLESMNDVFVDHDNECIGHFADDTAVHVGSLGDIVIYRKTLIDYSSATGGMTTLPSQRQCYWVAGACLSRT